MFIEKNVWKKGKILEQHDTFQFYALFYFVRVFFLFFFCFFFLNFSMG